MEKLITGKGFASCDEQQEVIDKLCSDYRRNLIRRFQESNSENIQKQPPPPPTSTLLGVNALIGEHLHSQGYYLSQSAFSVDIELPRPSHPADDSARNYRLKQADIEEVLGALNLPIKSQQVSKIIEKYHNSTDTSLLATLLLGSAGWSGPQLQEHRQQSTNDDGGRDSRKDLMAFNKYLKILVARIAKVSIVLSELKRKRTELNKQKCRRSSPRHNHRSRRENSQIQDLAKKIDKLSQRLADIQSTTGNEFSIGNCGGGQGSSGKSYNEWIKELRDSRHGQRMIRKIEKIIVNSLNKEQSTMQRNFDEKLETQKMILKLHYKQRFLEHFQALNLSNEAATKGVRPTPPLPVSKFPVRNKHGLQADVEVHHPLRKIKTKRKKQKQEQIPEKSTESSGKEVKKEEPKVKSNRAVSKQDSAEVVDGNQVVQVTMGDKKNVKNSSGEERGIRLKNVEQLIKDAKERIKLLQAENDRLDQSFNTYLDRQSAQTTNFQRDATAVWASYNVDRMLLQKQRRSTIGKVDTSITTPVEPQGAVVNTKFVTVPEIHIERCKSNLDVDDNNKVGDGVHYVSHNNNSVESKGSPMIVSRNNSSAEFSNPFINFDVKRFLESTTKTEKERFATSTSE